MALLDLSGLDWRLWGWRPFAWRLAKRPDGTRGPSDIGPLSAKVPGTVQQSLLDAGIIKDWNVGLQSRECEWVEHRHWEFGARVPAASFPAGETVVLEAECLDYSGWLFVDNKEVARFEGSMLPYRFDLTEAFAEGKEHEITLFFEEPPREQGQIGYTSRSHFFKARYNYSWDWCPRIVPIGPCGTLRLVSGIDAACSVETVRSVLDADLSTGSVEIVVKAPDGATVTAALLDDSRTLAEGRIATKDGAAALRLEAGGLEPWWPNGFGPQHLYDVAVTITSREGTPWTTRRRVGFRRVVWEACEGAPAGAEPWICVVNGQRVFLQGVNWVPPRAMHADATRAEYERLITLYEDMGCTILRVWGGAILETETFYSLCDEAGLMVWQEFPLSSSGVENNPPREAAAIAALESIARSYIQRRAHHASLLMWCGGNELTGGQDGSVFGDYPITYDHPCIAALRQVVETCDPGRRFVSSSSSGPLFAALPENFGKGLHHDTHGPWGMGPFGSADFSTLDGWRAYWEADDSLLRSEVGMPGACDYEILLKYAGGNELWPPTPASPYWMHTAAWWMQWERFEPLVGGLPPEEGLREYVRLTQALQTDAYAIAAHCCKAKFPRCGGFIIWMGHDLFPCPVNNAVIDCEQRPKPAYFALKEVFTAG